jgi:hypothetical protein
MVITNTLCFSAEERVREDKGEGELTLPELQRAYHLEQAAMSLQRVDDY